MNSKHPVRVILILGLIFTLMLVIAYRISIVFLCLYLSAAFLIGGKAAQAKSILKAIPEILLGAIVLGNTLDRPIVK